MSLIPFREKTATRIDLNIEQLLAALKPFAFVRMFNSPTDDTWSATADMRVKTEGATFEVKSGYKHATCKDALQELLARVETAIATLGQNK